MASLLEFEENMKTLQEGIKEVEDAAANLRNGHARALEELQHAGQNIATSAAICQEWTG